MKTKIFEYDNTTDVIVDFEVDTAGYYVNCFTMESVHVMALVAGQMTDVTSSLSADELDGFENWARKQLESL